MGHTTFVCSHCGAVRSIDELVLVGDESICEDCALEYTDVCDRCGTRIWHEDSVHDERTTLCEECFDRSYTRCDRCNRIISYDDACYESDGDYVPYCEDCYEERNLGLRIHEYSYHPEPIFYGEGNRYLGVELEIDDGGKDADNAKEILKIANAEADHLYIKSDGSLSNGMELVTHPMTLDYHVNSMPWEEILNEACSMGYRSHKTNTCGLHIHISRKAFGETETEQECTIARLLYFVEKFWPELLRFSRRTEYQINRWAARYGMKLSPKEVMSHAKYSCPGRYMAVNLTNWHTIEIRIFRGTLKLNTLIATLQMVNAICDVALFMSDEELQALSWHDFLDTVHELELIQYLKERNLYKNEPVTTEEDN